LLISGRFEKQINKQIKFSGLKTLFFKVTLVVKGQSRVFARALLLPEGYTPGSGGKQQILKVEFA
jgi:hypothetical protein